MKRNTLNFVTDLASALVMLALIGTGLIIRFVLPPGSGRGRVLWSLDRHQWGDVHFWVAVAAGLLLLVHVALHWQWVCTTIARLLRPRAGAGLGPVGRNIAGAITILLLVGAFTGFVWVAQGQVHVQAGDRDALRERTDAPHAEPDSHLRGSMTLSEAAAELGISTEELRQRLNVPPDVPDDERLGALSRRIGVPMSELRRLAER